MLCVGLIHGDLSEFNVLVAPDGPVIIDLPQVVNAAGNNAALAMLERDVNNLRATLGRFAPELLATEFAREMWALFEQGELRPDSEAHRRLRARRDRRRSGRRHARHRRRARGRDPAPAAPGQLAAWPRDSSARVGNQPEASRASAAATMAWKRGSSRSGSRSGSTLAWFRRPMCAVANTGPSMLERGVRVLQLDAQCAGEVVAHVHVVGIDQQRAVHPFLGALGLRRAPRARRRRSPWPRRCSGPAPGSSRRARARRCAARERPAAIADGRVAGDQHAGAN